MRIEHIRQRLRDLDARACHEERMLRAWTRALPLDAGSCPADQYFPLAMRKAFPAIACCDNSVPFADKQIEKKFAHIFFIFYN